MAFGRKCAAYFCRQCGCWHLGEKPHTAIRDLRISVYFRESNPEIDPPARHIKRARAEVLVFMCQAVWLSEDSIQLVPRKTNRQGQQGMAYELAAIDKHPRVLLGGLTRNEHNPKPYPIASQRGHSGESKQTSSPDRHLLPQRKSRDRYAVTP